METATGATRMHLVGGDLALDFVNTRTGPPVGPADDDVLTGYPEWLAWSGYAGALSAEDAESLRRAAGADPAGAGAAFARALRTRDDLDLIFRGLAEGARPEQSALARLRDDTADAVSHARLDPGPTFGWSWADDHTLLRPLWPVVHAAVRFLTTGALDRLKVCGGCRFVFHDVSKNRSRRWCRMDDCGSAEKVRRYVANRRARATG